MSSRKTRKMQMMPTEEKNSHSVIINMLELKTYTS